MNHYHVDFSDLRFYQQAVACQFACPVRTDGRAYVSAIARGEYERAYLIARETNPFASTCGWVCGAPCEAACRRGKIDAPIAIRALKRFVNDRYGVYLGETGKAQEPPAWPAYIGQTDAFDLGNTIFPTSRSGLIKAWQQGDKTGKRVAVVGSGPAGLSCAHDLSLLGHEVTIFDSAPVPGGMLRLGVPEYRLPRELIDLEIKAILTLGPILKLEQALGKDFSLNDLEREFDAIFLAIGTYNSRNLNVDGEHLDGVLRAVDFLINVNLGGYNLDLGKRVLVIGGGNVAMDVARTAARLGDSVQSGGDIEVALDVARTAVRLGSTEEVLCLVVEMRDEMLAEPIEILEAMEEGVAIKNLVAPKRILGEFDWIQPGDGLEVTRRGTLKVDQETLATTMKGVYAGGDIAFGPRLIINAVADGQLAARSIHTYLQKVEARWVRKGFFVPISKREYPRIGPLRNYLRHSHQQPPLLPVERRIGVSLVEESYSETSARQQGSRCLICRINPIFDGNLCILCNGCVDVCPMDCLKLVPVSKITGNEKITGVIERHSLGWDKNSAMLFDPTLCIRCGVCADRCPTEAITMESFSFSEEVFFENLLEAQG
jgi:NADPH-dependent glutamate synthase beta subunit-like oxidoreductase/ferredoxin